MKMSERASKREKEFVSANGKSEQLSEGRQFEH
jgi:hypothetical protein